MDITAFEALRKGDIIYFTSKPNILWTVESKDTNTLAPSGSNVKKTNKSICPYTKGCILISSPTPNGRHNPLHFYILNKRDCGNWTVKTANPAVPDESYIPHFYDLKLFKAENLNIRYLSVHMHFQNKFKENLVFVDILNGSTIDTSKFTYKNYKLNKAVTVNGTRYWYCVEIIIGAKVDPFTGSVVDSPLDVLNYTGDNLSIVKLAVPGLITGPIDLHWYAKDIDGNRIHFNGENVPQLGFDYNTTTNKVILNNNDINLVKATPYKIDTDGEVEGESGIDPDPGVEPMNLKTEQLTAPPVNNITNIPSNPISYDTGL